MTGTWTRYRRARCLALYHLGAHSRAEVVARLGVTHARPGMRRMVA